MSFGLQPWQLLLMILGGWIQRHQHQQLEFQRTQLLVLLEVIGKKRILLNDDQHRRLAVKGKILGPKALQEVATIVKPDSILRWHRMLVAQKWDYSKQKAKKLGRPPVSEEVTRWCCALLKRTRAGDPIVTPARVESSSTRSKTIPLISPSLIAECIPDMPIGTSMLAC